MQNSDTVGKAAARCDFKTWGFWGWVSEKQQVKGSVPQCFVKKKGKVGVHNSKKGCKYNLYVFGL